VKDNDLAKTVLGKAPAKKNIQEGGRRLWHAEEQQLGPEPIILQRGERIRKALIGYSAVSSANWVRHPLFWVRISVFLN
jgi:hypothetical protein